MKPCIQGILIIHSDDVSKLEINRATDTMKCLHACMNVYNRVGLLGEYLHKTFFNAIYKSLSSICVQTNTHVKDEICNTVCRCI